MVQGIGTDIIEISRIRGSIERHGQSFLDRVFTSAEQEYCLKHREAAPYFAARFAAKEAVVKALGTGFRDGLTWLDIEILNDVLGKPQVFLSPGAGLRFGHPKVLLTLSHCKEYAVAFALAN